jgi:hypothetical protein
MNCVRLWVTVAFILPTASAWPCAFDYPADYFAIGGRDVYALPEMMFDSEYVRILGVNPEIIRESSSVSVYPPSRDTAEVDVSDLTECLSGDADAEHKINAYSLLREAIDGYARELLEREYNGYGNDMSENAVKDELPPFKIDSFEEILLLLPEEFKHYIQGAVAFYNKAYEEGVGHFSSVLALEKDKRVYRSVWAAFMLGRTMLEMDQPEKAIPFFEQTRALAAAGFKDSLHLVEDSWGLQGRAARLSGDFVAAIHNYVEFRKMPGFWNLAGISLSRVFREIISADAFSPELIQDDMARQLVTAWICSRPDLSKGVRQEWLYLADRLPKDVQVIGAEKLAWLAYQCGEMESAVRWLKCSQPDAPHAQWVRAKLLLREGKIEEGTAILEELARLSVAEEWNFINADLRVPAADVLMGEIAGGMLMDNRYEEALKALLLAGNWGDAAYIAERIMTLGELRRFVRKYKTDGELVRKPVRNLIDDEEGEETQTTSWIDLVEHLLARRLARSGQWDKAALHYPAENYSVYVWQGYLQRENTPSLEEQAVSVSEHLKGAHDLSLLPGERARHLYEAAKIIREDGMDLLGTELAPDWRLFRGDDYFDDSEILMWGEKVLTPKAIARIAKSAIEMDKRFHYRYVAANLMKQCADLLPKNNVLAAEALYLGGKYLEKRDPEAADPFYKALVRRNPNLLIAQKADKLRWFPSEFTDAVIYTPSKWHGLSRKRVLFLLLCITPPVFLAGMVVGRRIGREEKWRRYIA